MSQSQSSEQDIKPPKVEVIDSDTDTTGEIILQFRQAWLQFQGWFRQLPLPAKAAVAIAVLFVSLSLLTKVLHLVASVISVAILGVILFGLYRFFMKSDSV